MREEIKSQVEKLVGLKLQYAGRASNLFWLGFGDIVQIVRRGRTEETLNMLYIFNVRGELL